MTDYATLSDQKLSLRIADIRGDYRRYASNLNAASELLRECFGTLEWDGEAWQVEAHGYLYASHPTNPARAVCEVWLLWKDAQGE